MRSWLFLALVGCGRLGFDSARSADAAAGDDAAADATVDVAPCGPLGTVRATYSFPTAQSQMIDTNRFLVTPANIYVAAITENGQQVFRLDHALNDLGNSTIVLPGGNINMSLDPVDGLIYASNVANANAALGTFDLAGVQLRGPMLSGVNLASGAVGPDGHLHVPDTNGGIREYTSTLSFVMSWGTTAQNPSDMVYDPVTGIMYHLGLFAVRGFDMQQVMRPEIVSFPPPSPMYCDGIALDAARGRIYIHRRMTKQLWVLDLAGNILDAATFGGDPASLEYDPYSDRLLVGLFDVNSSTTTVNAVCAEP